jgi:calcineurin-like phosphoesterase family protein
MLHIKKSRKDYNRILFNSDFHYGHNRDFLYIPRGFQSAEEHTAWIDAQVASLNEDDLLICLGDVGLSIGPSAIIDFINRIPCETLMVWGNHNSGVLQAYKDAIHNLKLMQALPTGVQEIYPLQIADRVTMVGDSFLLDIDRDRFYCTHMSPLIFPDQGKGRVCVCGHSHSNLKQINPSRDDFGKILDCGVENAIRNNKSAFFDLDEVVELLKQKKVSTLDHHGA